MALNEEKREGVTTGSCAAAAAKAAALWLTTGECPERVDIETPTGRILSLDVTPLSVAPPGVASASCGVVKDAGDDPDATDGLMVAACVEPREDAGPVEFRAGEGVGVVTLPGLKVPVGEPAINPVPRRMIEKVLREIFGPRSVVATISVPGGEALAKRTFNPRLGIVGGLSILGTRGTVKPMDEQALLESLTLELNTHAAEGKKALALTFGNTGELALRKAFGFTGRCVLQMGNLVGFVLDEAERLGFRQILLCGHPGKLLKVAAGSFNTHNRVADGRREALCTHAALAGLEYDFIRRLYACATTENAVALIRADKKEFLWDRLAETAAQRCVDRSFDKLSIAIAFLDNDGTILGKSERVDSFVEKIKSETANKEFILPSLTRRGAVSFM
jgi:cobalt-precorrin-5B (C1)-methyltransferase